MRRTVIILGTTQTLAWASSYYLPAIVAAPVARDLGVGSTWVFAAFSAALVVSGLLGPRVGRTIDAIGGRAVLAASNLVIAAGLALLAAAHGQAVLWLAWLVLGAGMGLGLYDAAFAALGRFYGEGARPAITGITLIAGFASTVGWPLSGWGVEEIGWRGTCLAWAAANLAVGLPLNALLLPRTPREAAAGPAAGKPRVAMDRTMWLLGFAFAAAWMVTAAMAAHLPRILEAAGASAAVAIGAGALIGPSQVAARLLEAATRGRAPPLVVARLAAVAHPVGAGLFMLSGGALPYLFVVLHGAGNGILTIARGTVPLAVFGAESYGYRLGLLGVPARVAQAAAPLLFGLLLDRLGQGVLFVTAGLSLAALAAFLGLRPRV